MASSCKKLFISRKTVLPGNVQPAILITSNGKIEKIIPCNNDSEINKELQNYPNVERQDFGNLILMPGIIDTHVHVNEPGKTHWEGFLTATRAAAAGGVTTIIDMPLNAIPPTTNVENLKKKVVAAKSKALVNIGFWGGVVPGNQKDLKPLVEAGVIGFKCFMCPSGDDYFHYVEEDDMKKALNELKDLDTVLACHAECDINDEAYQPNGDPADYNTYLQTRPQVMEIKAITKVINLCETYNCRCHIVHLSASEALNLVKKAKDKNLPLSAETCFHYLYLTANKIPRNSPEFKCCPPIRDAANKEKLWSALKDGTLNMVVSDHSPCPDDMKTSDFIKSWGGISSLQFGLSIFWTEGRKRGINYHDIVRLLCSGPAKLCRFESRKGELAVGMDADFVVWNPDEMIEIEKDKICHKNKLTPYLGEKLFGKVFATVVRGNFVYKNGEFSSEPYGQLLLRDKFLDDLLN